MYYLVYSNKQHNFKHPNCYQNLWKVEEFGYEFFDIIHILENIFPSLRHRVKLSVRHIEPSRLQLDVQRGERLHPDHVVKDHRRVGVMSAIVKFGHSATGIFKLKLI